MKLSVVIPAHNEADTIAATVSEADAVLEREGIEHEILVVDDLSTDGTADLIEEFVANAGAGERIKVHRRRHGRGFGLTVRAGLERFDGDAVAIMMADGSDDPEDLVRYHRLLLDGYDCAFGSRFIHGAEVVDYPRLKLVLNRVVNRGIRLLFRHRYDDTTNAFKAYRREVIDSVQPLLSNHFNLTVEIPLKAVIRGHSYGIVPISWRERTGGESKLALKEMGSRYLFIVLYTFLEHHLSRGDYRQSSYEPRSGWIRAKGRLLGGGSEPDHYADRQDGEHRPPGSRATL
jgi:dolichol-phosphate mannosyltransferase